MTAIEDGDRRLEGLWAAHAPRLHAYARRHADAGDAEDLVAEAYLAALRRISVSEVPADVLAAPSTTTASGSSTELAPA